MRREGEEGGRNGKGGKRRVGDGQKCNRTKH